MSRLHPNVRAALDEIKAHPADDTPRLMLADWLEENGETESERARGTVLRLGCQAATRPDWDPHRILEEAQVNALFRKHREAWLGDVPAERFTLRRGLLHLRVDEDAVQVMERFLEGSTGCLWVESVDVFLDESSVSDASVRSRYQTVLSRLLAEVRQLTVAGFGVGAALGLLHRIDTARLTTLGIGYKLNGEHWRSLLALPFDSLQELTIPDLENDGVRDWSCLRRLRALHLFPDVSAGWSAGPWPNLEELSLGRTTAGMFSRGEDWPRLCRLRVRNSQAAMLPADLARSSVLERLETLELSHTGGQTLAAVPGLAAIAGSQRATRLRRLCFRDHGLKRSTLSALVARTAFPALRELSFKGMKLDSQRAAILARSPLLGQLDSLDLGDLDEAGAELLGSVPELCRLRHLGLVRSPAWLDFLGHDQPARLVQLDLEDRFTSPDWWPLRMLTAERLPDLIGLSLLRNTGYDPSAIEDLARWPFLRQIRVLDLKDWSLDEASVRALLDSPHFSNAAWIRINDSGFPQDLCAAWCERFGPECLTSDIPF
jgi:uncharacterized protein (TIGR02996 family)